MLVHHAGAFNYLLTTLEGMPEVCDQLLSGLGEAEADFKPDVDRFSIREVMAHLADWDAVFLERMERTRDEDIPLLESIDEGRRALDLEYAHADLSIQHELFVSSRSRLMKFVRSVRSEEWERLCLHPKLGPTTLESQVMLVALHDGYHLRQLAQWRKGFASKDQGN